MFSNLKYMLNRLFNIFDHLIFEKLCTIFCYCHVDLKQSKSCSLSVVFFSMRLNKIIFNSICNKVDEFLGGLFLDHWLFRFCFGMDCWCRCESQVNLLRTNRFICLNIKSKFVIVIFVNIEWIQLRSFSKYYLWCSYAPWWVDFRFRQLGSYFSNKLP